MLLTQNSHLHSTATARQFQQSQKSIAQSVERLASAKRVNSAKDDAAGLSIHTRLEQQTRTTSKERANLQQQISFAQTAQGTLSEVQDRLMRLRELSIQASTATLSEQGRKSMQDEAQDILKMIDKLSQAEFNQKKIFGESYTFDTGKTQQNPQGITKIDLSELESRSLTRISQERSMAGVNAFVDWKEGDIRLGRDIRWEGDQAVGGFEVRATQASDDTVSTEYNAGSAIAKAAAINAGTDDHGVSAQVEASTAHLTINRDMNLGGNALEINGVIVGNLQIKAGDSNHTLINYLNEFSGRTGVVASQGENNKVLLTAEDGRNISIEAIHHSIAQQLGFFDNQKASYHEDKKIVVGGRLTLASEQNYQLYYENPIMNESLGLIHSPRPFNRDFVQFRVESGGKMIFYRVNDQVGRPFSNAYTADPNSEVPSYIKSINGYRLDVNRMTSWKNFRSPTQDMDGPLELIHAFEGFSSIQQVNYRELVLPGHHWDGREVDAHIDRIYRYAHNRYRQPSNTFFQNGLDFEFDASKMHLIDMYRTSNTDDVDAFKTVIFEPIYNYESGARYFPNIYPPIVEQGLVQLRADESNLQVKTIDFSSQESAQASIEIIDQALEEITDNQGQLGALQNSLEHSINRVEQSQSDLIKADERIMSTDFATESAELTRAQIQQNLGQKLLTKVNIDAHLALALVRSGRRQI